MELLVVLLILLLLAAPVLAVVFFALYLIERSKVKSLEAKLKAVSASTQTPVTQNEVNLELSQANTPIQAPVNTQVQAPATPEAPIQVPVAPAAPTSQIQASVTAPVQKTAPITPAPKKFSGVGITFAVGVLLLTIVAAVFVSSSWSFIGDIGRVIVLLAYVAVVFGLSFLSDRVLKLKQTGFAFYTLGSFLLPVIITGIGALELFGDAFSIKAGNGALVGAIAALSFGVCGFVGTRIYKKKSYYAISYLGFTWALLFIAGQIGGVDSGFVALGVLALILQVVNYVKKDLDIKFFRIYSEIVTYIAAASSFIFMFSDKDVLAIIGCLASTASLVLLSMNPKRSWVSYIAPIVALTTWISSIHLIYVNNISVLHIVGIIILAVIYIAFVLCKKSNYVTDFLYPFTMLIFALFVEDGLTIGGLIALIMASAILMSMVWRNNTGKVVKVISAIAFSWFIPLILRNFFALTLGKEVNHTFICMIVWSVIALLSFGLRFFFGEAKKFQSRLTCEALTSACILFFIFGVVTISGYRSIVASVIFTLLWILLIASVSYKKAITDKVSISVVVFSIAAMISFVIVLGNTFDYFSNINFDYFYITSLVYLLTLSVLFKFLPKNLIGNAYKYMKPLGFAAGVLSTIMLIMVAIAVDYDWLILLLAVLTIAILIMHAYNYLGFIPMFIVTIVLHDMIDCMVIGQLSSDLLNLASFIILGVLGRVLHKKVFTNKLIDWFSLIPLVVIFMYNNDEFVPLTIALFVLNFIGRVKTSTKVLISISSVFVYSFIFSILNNNVQFFNDNSIRFFVVMLILWALTNRYAIKPFKDTAMRIIWFVAVSLSLLIEGVAALGTGDIVDLLITGIASVVIFIVSFIIKRKLWFVQSLVSILLIGLYFSITFGSSIVWLVYLLVTGAILITIAAVNESRKRKYEKQNTVSEWKW